MESRIFKMKTILLVEDNPVYLEAAVNHLKTRGVNFYLASNYDDNAFGALKELNGRKLDGVITDCFFRRNSTNDIELGKYVSLLMLGQDPEFLKARTFLEEAKKHFAWDEEIEGLWRDFALHTTELNPLNSPLYRAAKQVTVPEAKEGGTMLAKKILKEAYKVVADPYEVLNLRMEQDTTFQPLGILIGEKAKELNIPCVFATSGYHHGLIVQQMCNWISRRSLGPVVDCPPGKEDYKGTDKFWSQAYSTLEGKL